jgi:ribosomal protein S27AE
MTTRKRADAVQLGDCVDTPAGRGGIVAAMISPDRSAVVLQAAGTLDSTGEVFCTERYMAATEEIEVQPGFACPRCLNVSHNPKDAEHLHCGHCHIFWPKLP